MTRRPNRLPPRLPGCLPIVDDLDCDDRELNGGTVRLRDPEVVPYRLDDRGVGNGNGCDDGG